MVPAHLSLIVDNTIKVQNPELTKQTPKVDNQQSIVKKVHKPYASIINEEAIKSIFSNNFSINGDTNDILKVSKEKYVLITDDQTEYDTGSTINGGDIMEINPKEYIDGKIESLEKTIEVRLDAQDNLFSEKIDHLHTKIDSTLDKKFSEFKEKLDTNKKESRKFFLTTIISTVSIAVAVLGIAVGILIAWLT